MMNFEESILAAKNIMLEAFESIYVNKAILSKKLLIYIILNIFVGLIILLTKNHILSLILQGFDYIFISVMIAVITHRIILLGKDSVSNQTCLSWAERETGFAMYYIFSTIGFVVICFGISIFSVGIVRAFSLRLPEAFFYIIPLFLGSWILSRLSLVFPAAAIDKETSFGLSFRLTKNFQVLMFIVVVALPILLAIPAAFVAILPASFFSFFLNDIEDLTLIRNIMISFFRSLYEVLIIAILSITYKYIMEKTPEDQRDLS